MFIDRMSNNDLLQEYLLDLPEIQANTSAFDKSGYVEKTLWKKRKSGLVVFPRRLNTKRNNNYLGVVIYSSSGKEKWGWESYHMGIMNTERGSMALSFYLSENMAIKHTRHFFNRYKERLMKVCDWWTRNQLVSADTYDKLVILYLQRNQKTSLIRTNSVYKNKKHIFAPTMDGVTLMQWDEQYRSMQANTFITYDMLDEKQRRMLSDTVKYCNMSADEQDRLDDPLFRID